MRGMSRWLVIFKSHAEGLADVHFVDVTAKHALEAVHAANAKRPPPGPWVFASAVAWPRGCASVNEAALAFAG